MKSQNVYVLLLVKHSFETRKRSHSYGEYRETSIANNDAEFGFVIEFHLRI